MKKSLFAGPLFLIAMSLSAAVPATAPNISVTLKEENRELALGFASAFGSIKNVPTHVVLQREGRTTVLPDIRRVTAVGSVLVLENGKAQTYVVSPRDVVWLSDTPVEKERPADKTGEKTAITPANPAGAN